MDEKEVMEPLLGEYNFFQPFPPEGLTECLLMGGIEDELDEEEEPELDEGGEEWQNLSDFECLLFLLEGL